MKKIIYLCLIALLAMSFGCEKEDLYVSPTEESSKNFNINENLEGLDKKLDTKSNSSAYGKTANNTAENFYDENGNPVEVLDLYLDIDYIEANYPGLYVGSFSQHYQNEMSAHFTIHAVEYSSSNCGNIERWTVTKIEYENYILSIGGSLDGVIVSGSTGGTDNSSGSTGTGTTNTGEGWGDENGNVTQTPTKKPIKNDEAPQRSVPQEYVGCF